MTSSDQNSAASESKPRNSLRTISGTLSGTGHQAGPFPVTITRLMPVQVNAVGAFVFFDHCVQLGPVPEAIVQQGPTGHMAHPHRGIATLSYLINGDMQHFDSRGHSGEVNTGGAQWMKAGTGIVHDEWGRLDTGTDHPFQFLQIWINLSSQAKNEAPDYRAINDLPEIELPANAGSVRVVVGEYKGQSSSVPIELPQFMLHFKLKPGAVTSYTPESGHEVAAFVASGRVNVNGTQVQAEMVHFENEDGKISLKNGEAAADVFVFGGEPYREPMAMGGPFVMSTQEELIVAEREFQQGRYGEVDYSGYKPWPPR